MPASAIGEAKKSESRFRERSDDDDGPERSGMGADDRGAPGRRTSVPPSRFPTPFPR
jgi:hypothetical protein